MTDEPTRDERDDDELEDEEGELLPERVAMSLIQLPDTSPTILEQQDPDAPEQHPE